MKVKKVLERCKGLIAEAKVSQAIGILRQKNSLPEKIKQELHLISYRFNRIYKDLVEGIITYERYSVENNKIVRNLMSQICELEYIVELDRDKKKYLCYIFRHYKHTLGQNT